MLGPNAKLVRHRRHFKAVAGGFAILRTDLVRRQSRRTIARGLGVFYQLNDAA
jgi:hypothetical protein